MLVSRQFESLRQLFVRDAAEDVASDCTYFSLDARTDMPPNTRTHRSDCYILKVYLNMSESRRSGSSFILLPQSISQNIQGVEKSLIDAL